MLKMCFDKQVGNIHTTKHWPKRSHTHNKTLAKKISYTQRNTGQKDHIDTTIHWPKSELNGFERGPAFYKQAAVYLGAVVVNASQH